MKKNIKIKTAVLSVLLMISGLSGLYAMPDFKMKDTAGKEIRFSDFEDKKAVVLIFVSTQCPVSNAYNERMEALHKKYSDQIPVIGINSNKAESVENIKDHALKNSLTFPILKDNKNSYADSLKASFTPEVYVFSGKGKLLYHGRIDDSRRDDKVKTRDLANALIEILAGKNVTVTETKAFGCTIKRIKK